MTMARQHGLSIRIDHQAQVVHLLSDVMDKDRMRFHLSALSSRLSLSMTMIMPTVIDDNRRNAVMALAKGLPNEHKKLLARKSIIEQRKQDDEANAARRQHEV